MQNFPAQFFFQLERLCSKVFASVEKLQKFDDKIFPFGNSQSCFYLLVDATFDISILFPHSSGA